MSVEPLVIDSGSGSIKAGFAAGEQPDVIFQSYVGRPKHQQVMAVTDNTLDAPVFIGDAATELRGVLALSRPMAHGSVHSWDDMCLLWKHIYSELKVSASEHPVLLTESPLNPSKNRAKMAEIFFEKFNVPALYIQAQSILSLYASGRTTGVVLDCGDGVSSTVPIFEGFAVLPAIQRIDIGGHTVTEQLKKLLRKRGYSFYSSSELEILRTVKEARCYISEDPAQEPQEGDKKTLDAGYLLPDGTRLHLGNASYRAPELLFKPSLIGLEYPGVHDCVLKSVMACDLDIRGALLGFVLLSGGSTQFQGFGKRLCSELQNSCSPEVNIKIYAPANRTTSAWTGGSILASLATFQRMYVSKQEYMENGVHALQNMF
jgi:centractin